jgi:hypothetical protein
VIAYEGAVHDTLFQDAIRAKLGKKCAAPVAFTDYGSRVVTADLTALTVRLSLQRFTLYWQANCTTTSRCCGNCYTVFNCAVSFQLYDVFDFEDWNPLSLVGAPFQITGNWTRQFGGVVVTAGGCP